MATKTAVQQSTLTRIQFLDGLRGVAALSVVFGHAIHYSSTSNKRFGSTRFGLIHINGVFAFFVLSSFLLTVILYNRLVKDRQANHPIRRTLGEYFIRRFMRVYPLYFIICIFLRTMPSWNPHYTMGPAFYSRDAMLLIRSPSLAWTIPIEMQSYLILPVIVFSVYYAGKFWVLPTLCLAIYTWIHSQYYASYPFSHITANLLECLSIFLYGAIAGVIYVKFDEFITNKELRVKYPKICWITAVIADGMCWILFAFFSWIAIPAFNQTFGDPQIRPSDPKYQAPIFSAILFLAMLSQRSFSRVFEWSFLLHCGKISFGLYLTHYWALWCQQKVLNGYEHEGLIATFLLAIALATIVYSTIEVSCQKVTSALVKLWHELCMIDGKLVRGLLRVLAKLLRLS